MLSYLLVGISLLALFAALFTEFQVQQFLLFTAVVASILAHMEQARIQHMELMAQRYQDDKAG